MIIRDRSGILIATMVSSERENAPLSKRIAFVRSNVINQQGRVMGNVISIVARRGCSDTWPALFHELK
jgi:hypothetical protein